MKKAAFCFFAITLAPFFAYGVDGVVLINQSTVMAAGGFPYTITAAGSYKLSGNLAVDQNTTAIVVAHDNVTIDLNGFTIGGPNSCVIFPVPSCSASGTGNGIYALGHSNLTITNGTINGMGNYGINAENIATHIEAVFISNNGADGIIIAGGMVDKCVITSNGRSGVNANGGGGSVQGNLIQTNASFGLALASGWSYSQNTFFSNGSGGSSNVTGSGVNLGQNLCGNDACPNAFF